MALGKRLNLEQVESDYGNFSELAYDIIRNVGKND
jgi:hypothetical protein